MSRKWSKSLLPDATSARIKKYRESGKRQFNKKENGEIIIGPRKHFALCLGFRTGDRRERERQETRDTMFVIGNAEL